MVGSHRKQTWAAFWPCRSPTFMFAYSMSIKTLLGSMNIRHLSLRIISTNNSEKVLALPEMFHLGAKERLTNQNKIGLKGCGK